MNILSGLIHKFAPFSFKDSINLRLNRSYRRFRLTLFSVMILIAIVPVIITAGLGYHNYRDLLQAEERGQLESRLDSSIKSIEAMVNSLTSVVLFVAQDDRYTELITGDNLEKLFVRIKDRHNFFADLGVIDQDGIQQAYFGPYNLGGTDYSTEPWLRDVIDKGLYISRVYTGYRQIPHFAIAVSNVTPTTGATWVLRATIDAVTLQQFVNTIKTNSSDDLFLVDDEGYLQTPSANYGQTLLKIQSGPEILPHNGLSEKGKNLLHGIGKIENSPWSLILVEKQYIHQDDWTTFRAKLLTIVISCLAISLLVVYGLVTLLTNLIHKADKMQMTMLREAEHTDKLASIGRLAAGVGHEINNPLAIIDQKTGLVEDLLLMSPQFEHRETIEGCLKVINGSVERCKAITHRLLGFARRAGVRCEALQVNDILQEVLLFLENSMVHNRIHIDLQLQDNLPLISSDHLQLQQVFLNIINNAIDAVAKDGIISITTQQTKADVLIFIEDNGHGIDTESLPYIFEPFFTTKETGKGTGLGLSITYGLIKKLAGDISVQSQIDRGTTFTITLPLSRGENDTNREK